MKALIYSFLFIAFSVVLLQSFDTFESDKRKKDGTDPGYTGSPGDFFKNCTVCHGGVADNAQGWITSNIPSTGWKPGQIYTITATNTFVGSNRFGFEISPQDKKGNLLGEMIITDTGTTKLVGANKYITYKAAGVDGTDSKSWTFDWKAPADTINEVVFYGAFNSNHDGMKAEDRTFLSTLTVRREGAPVSVHHVNKVAELSLFPNPASECLNIKYNNTAMEPVQIYLYDVNGNLVREVYKGKDILIDQTSNVDDLENGLYFLMVRAGSATQIKTVTVF